MATSYPARARREAISLPIPELAPVTITDGRAVIAARSRKRQADRGGGGDRAVANHVVDNDEGARPGKLDGPLEIAGIVWLVGVDEDEIERTEPLFLNDGERVEC